MTKAVVIGSGSIGDRHSAVLAQLLSPDDVHQLPAGLRSGQTSSDVIQSVLDLKPDYVVIAAPAHLHWSFLSPLLATNTPVLVEKPLVASRDDFNAINNAYRQGKLVNIQAGFNLHYRPEVKFIEQQLEQIGEVLWAEFKVGQRLTQWRPGRDLHSTVSLNKEWGGGALLELSHEFDLACYFFRHLDVLSARTQRGVFTEDVEEAAQVSLTSDSGATMNVLVDFHRPVPERQISISGINGFIHVDFVRQKGYVSLADNLEHVDFSSEDTYLNQAKSFLGLVPCNNADKKLDSAIRCAELVLRVKETLTRE